MVAQGPNFVKSYCCYDDNDRKFPYQFTRTPCDVLQIL